MCHGKGLNNKINNIHERALRVIYQDKKSIFQTLLKREKSKSVHVKNLPHLAAELSKIKNNLSWKKFLFFKKMELTIWGVVII